MSVARNEPFVSAIETVTARIVCIYKTCFHFVLCHIFHVVFSSLSIYLSLSTLISFHLPSHDGVSVHFQSYGRNRMQMSGQMLYGPKTITWKYIYLHAKFRFGIVHIILQRVYADSSMLKVTSSTLIYVCQFVTYMCSVFAYNICCCNIKYIHTKDTFAWKTAYWQQNAIKSFFSDLVDWPPSFWFSWNMSSKSSKLKCIFLNLK